jgi:hypothetical protein
MRHPCRTAGGGAYSGRACPVARLRRALAPATHRTTPSGSSADACRSLFGGVTVPLAGVTAVRRDMVGSRVRPAQAPFLHNDSELGDRLGHSTVQITADVYGHLFPETNDLVSAIWTRHSAPHCATPQTRWPPSTTWAPTHESDDVVPASRRHSARRKPRRPGRREQNSDCAESASRTA